MDCHQQHGRNRSQQRHRASSADRYGLRRSPSHLPCLTKGLASSDVSRTPRGLEWKVCPVSRARAWLPPRACSPRKRDNEASSCLSECWAINASRGCDYGARTLTPSSSLPSLSSTGSSFFSTGSSSHDNDGKLSPMFRRRGSLLNLSLCSESFESGNAYSFMLPNDRTGVASDVDGNFSPKYRKGCRLTKALACPGGFETRENVSKGGGYNCMLQPHLEERFHIEKDRFRFADHTDFTCCASAASTSRPATPDTIPEGPPPIQDLFPNAEVQSHKEIIETLVAAAQQSTSDSREARTVEITLRTLCDVICNTVKKGSMLAMLPKEHFSNIKGDVTLWKPKDKNALFNLFSALSQPRKQFKIATYKDAFKRVMAVIGRDHGSDRFSVQDAADLQQSLEDSGLFNEHVGEILKSLIGEPVDGAAAVVSYRGTVLASAAQLCMPSSNYQLERRDGKSTGTRHQAAVDVGDWLQKKEAFGVVFVRSDDEAISVIYTSKEDQAKWSVGYAQVAA